MKRHQSKSSALEFDNSEPCEHCRIWRSRSSAIFIVSMIVIVLAVLAVCIPVLMMIAENW